MTDVTTIPELPIEIGPRSSIFEKTTPELRRKLDRAIVNYDPPGYLALFKKFGLAELGVSYHAFYHYARKLRRRAALRDMTQASLPDERDVVQSLPALLGQYLIDQIMANDQAGPNAIYRLMLAYTVALNNAVMVHEKRHIFAPRKPSPSEPPSRVEDPPWRKGAERLSNTVNLSTARESRTPDSGTPFPSEISNPEISNSIPAIAPNSREDQISNASNLVHPVNPVHFPDNRPLSESSLDELLTQSDRALEEQRAVLAARFEQVKKDFVAMSYPVADCKNLDEFEAIIARTDEDADPAAGAKIPSRTHPRGNPFPREKPTAPTSPEASPSEISNPEISNSIPAIAPNSREDQISNASNLVHPVNPVHSSDDALIPLETMRRTLPKSCPSCESSPPLPSLRSDDPALGAIDESPDSHQPGEYPKLPLIKQDFPDPDPQREARRQKVRAAYGRVDAVPHVKDWIAPELCAEFGLSPSPSDDAGPQEKLRRRELRGVLIRFGLMKDTDNATDQSRDCKGAPSDA